MSRLCINVRKTSIKEAIIKVKGHLIRKIKIFLPLHDLKCMAEKMDGLSV